jgi:hypothetical protein
VVNGGRAVLQWPEQGGRCKRAVDQEGESPSPRDHRESRQVRQAQQGVRDCLDKDRPRPIGDGRLDRSAVRGVGEAHGEAPARGLLPEEGGGRAIEILAGDEVLAGPEPTQEEGRQRAHARGDHEPGLAALERRQGVLQHRVVRRAEPAVDVAVFLALPDGVDLTEVVEHVHVRQVHGWGQRPRGRARCRNRSRGPCREPPSRAHSRTRHAATPPSPSMVGAPRRLETLHRVRWYLSYIIGRSSCSFAR